MMVKFTSEEAGMTRHAVRLAAVGALAQAVAACSDPKVANKSNFARAVAEAIATRPPCIDIPKGDGADPFRFGASARPPFPRYVRLDERATNGEANRQLDALVHAGLLRRERTQVHDVTGFAGPSRSVPALAYTLSDTGRVAVAQSDTVRRSASDRGESLCLGRAIVDEVTNFTEPGDAFGQKMSEVHYRFHVADRPAWVGDPAVTAAFPEIARQLADDQKGRTVLVLTNEGWKDQQLVAGS